MAGKKLPFGGKTIRPDAVLAKVIGSGKIGPTVMTKKLWNYFKGKKLLIRTATGPFGGMKVKPDGNLKAIGVKAAVAPSKVFKFVWSYIKRKKLFK